MHESDNSKAHWLASTPLDGTNYTRVWFDDTKVSPTLPPANPRLAGLTKVKTLESLA